MTMLRDRLGLSPTLKETANSPETSKKLSEKSTRNVRKSV
jgi:hypothetical protein